MVYHWRVTVDGTLVASGQADRLVDAHTRLVAALKEAGGEADGMLTYGVDRSRVRIRMTLVPGGVMAR